MCGIVGWLNWQGAIDRQETFIEQMTQTLAHRGPDMFGLYRSEYAQLGHSRLAVIDLEGGRQPMQRTINDLTYTIVYNGELYNTEKLRQQLIDKGYRFQSYSDTEVLLLSYVEWQERCVDYLDGIFAFAVWCEQNRNVFLCRDRLGVKPLFYVEREQELFFASEMKALLKHPTIDPIVDTRGLASLLSIGPSRNAGETVYANIKELKPAHYMRRTATRQHINCYWAPTTTPHPHTLEETTQAVHDLVEQAVEKQLISDVPLCTFLSGGIDSSVITAIAARQYQETGRVLHTYSVDYENNAQFFQQNSYQVSRDEYYINKMRKTIQLEHHTIMLKPNDLEASLEHAMYLKDYPSMADIDSSLFLFCREVKKDFTVAVSGECADEIFGGYPWFFQQERQFPWIRSLEQREALLKPNWRQRLQLASYLQESYEQAIHEIEDEREQLFTLNRHYFMQTLLERKDRMSMGSGLEVRVPFADHALVEYVWNIPWEMKIIDGYEKGILRRAMKGLVPDEILYRKKNPYPKTYHPNYTNIVKNKLIDCLQDRSSILHELFAEAYVKQLIDTEGDFFQKPWFGQLMSGPQLLAYFIQLHVWAKNYRIVLI